MWLLTPGASLQCLCLGTETLNTTLHTSKCQDKDLKPTRPSYSVKNTAAPAFTEDMLQTT